MKRVGMMICAIAAAAISVTALAQGNWQSQVAAASQDAGVLKQTMKGLSNRDQLSFVGAVNEAIAKKPGSATEKAKLGVAAFKAALESANADNRTAVIAETFATAPTESLTAINEELSRNLKAAGGDQTKLSNEVMDAVVKRTATSDDAGARQTFAALSFIRNNPSSKDALVSKLDPGTQEIAKSEWIDPALKGDYNPILGATNAEAAPDLANVNSLALPDSATAAILADMMGEPFGGEDGTLSGQGNIGLQARAVVASASSPGAGKFGTTVIEDGDSEKVILDPSHKRNGRAGEPSNDTPAPGPHPGPYQNQLP